MMARRYSCTHRMNPAPVLLAGPCRIWRAPCCRPSRRLWKMHARPATLSDAPAGTVAARGAPPGAPPAAPLIAHIIYRLDVGGLENGVVNLINRIPVERYRHAIICLAGYSDFRRRIERGDVAIF